MQPGSNGNKGSAVNRATDDRQLGSHASTAEPGEAASILLEGQTLKLIPWADIWSSLRVAKVRGSGEMIEVFYDTLFKEAIFDDKGAWSWNTHKRI